MFDNKKKIAKHQMFAPFSCAGVLRKFVWASPWAKELKQRYNNFFRLFRLICSCTLQYTVICSPLTRTHTGIARLLCGSLCS